MAIRRQTTNRRLATTRYQTRLDLEVSRLLVKLTNDARDYAWGSLTLFADRLGVPATGKPMAEIWFGTHPQSEAKTVPEQLGLSLALGRQLPFMMKFLAAGYPLSIQVHPDAQQALEGFESENAQNIGLDSDSRNFRDIHAKSEALVALTDFDILVGFESVEAIVARLQKLSTMVSSSSAALLQGYIEVLQSHEGHRGLIGEILRGDGSSPTQLALLQELSQLATDTQDADPREVLDLELLGELATRFGADRGLLLSLTMKRFLLKPGEAVLVEPGVAHCYLGGLGVEIMTSSDNVLRGGLTQKHVSPETFISTLDVVASQSVRPATKTRLLQGLEQYKFASDDFALHRVEVSSSNLLIDFGLPGESLMLCVEGELAISNSLDERLVLRRGEAAYLSADANFYSISGSGAGYLGSALSG